MSESATETGTKDTTGVVGNAAGTDTTSTASTKDTTGSGGGPVDDPGNSPATSVDTSGAQGGSGDEATDTSLTGTVSTLEPGGPRSDANPAYRAPSEPPPLTTRDTTLTDYRVAGGLDSTPASTDQTETFDTDDPKVPLQTTSDAIATAPAKPTVAGGPRSVKVTWVLVADPAGAPVRGYRIEGSTGGTRFAGRNKTSTVVDGLTPSMDYKFRVSAVTDNGTGPWSPWSDAAKPLNPDQNGPGKAVGITEANSINPIYRADGTVHPDGFQPA